MYIIDLLDNELISKLTLTIHEACYCFLVSSKLYVGGNFIEAFSLKEYPF